MLATIQIVVCFLLMWFLGCLYGFRCAYRKMDEEDRG